jgi:hypothetical protein
VNERQALSHPEKSETFRSGVRLSRIARHAAAVILDNAGHLVVSALQDNSDVLGSGMTHHIGDR